MQITRLKLKQFRNYAYLDTEVSPGINLFFGQNGLGKTNLLEAIHYCALGKSHRTNLDREVIGRGDSFAACGVTLEKRDGVHDVAVKLTTTGERKKQIFLDGKKAARLSAMMGMLKCVIFSPEDLQLVKDGPSVRRRFLDMMLSQISTAYFTSLQEYQQALNQRNAMLRTASLRGQKLPSSVELWEEAMAKAAAVIVRERQDCCTRLAVETKKRYASISGRDQEIFSLTYQPCLTVGEGMQERLLNVWREKRNEDLRRGTTTFGVHREEILLTLQGNDMKQFASQGQMRTAALAMKLSELTVFKELSGESPVLLLDDVMSELDVQRRRCLLDEIRGVQTFVTCTDENDISQREKYMPWQVDLDAQGNAVLKACKCELRRERVGKLTDDFLL